MDDLISFESALKASKSSGFKTSILLGNGFSIAFDGDRFSYHNLLEKSGLHDDSPIKRVFETLPFPDFEVVIKSLEDASVIALVYNYKEVATKFKEDASRVRGALIKAIQEVHPAITFEITQEQGDACHKFLKNFDDVFTTNYDLLLYWVIVRHSTGFYDGFQGGDEVNGFRIFDSNIHCNTFYLHGALHLFANDQREVLKLIKKGPTILGDIEAKLGAGPERPLIISEGTAAQKLSNIKSNPYLANGYDRLSKLSGSLFIFGSSASDSDSHIYDAICEHHSIKQIVFCVHNPAESLEKMREKLARYQTRRKTISWSYVDAGTIDVWGSKAKAPPAAKPTIRLTSVP